MILRRVTFERYGCFGSAEFDFRRGFNLISGGNETGKSLLLAALPAALLGVEHGARLRSWGDTLNCRVTLLFEGGAGRARLTRDLESNLVKLEEVRADGSWSEIFAGKLPPGVETDGHAEYHGHLARLFAVSGEQLLRALLDAVHPEAVLTADGCLAAGLLAPGVGDSVPLPPDVDPARRDEEIASLEADLAVDREDYRKGQEYLAWIRKRWESEGKAPSASSSPKASAGKGAAREQAALERKRDELQAKLRELGLPARLPADLPALFETAEGLRQELAALQLELTPLQRRKPSIVMPGIVWPLVATLAALAAAGGGFWQKLPWWLPLAAGCGALLVVIWTIYLVRLNRARTARDLLDQQIQAVEIRRADALMRQNELAEQFEFYGLPSAPVEMVKLQQLWRRNEALISRYRELCAQLGDKVDKAPGAGNGKAQDGHLQPEELPEAEARLAELGESVRRREARLKALRDGTASAATSAPTGRQAGGWTEKQLLQAVGQHLERLTAGRHREVRIEEGRLRLEAAPGRWAPAASCSRGTAEALILAVRMACAQLSGSSLPLTVDGLPVHLDARRQQAVLRDLERFAADHQLLLASCDEELAKRAARERWHLIRLKLSPTEQPAAREEGDNAGQLHLL